MLFSSGILDLSFQVLCSPCTAVTLLLTRWDPGCHFAWTRHQHGPDRCSRGSRLSPPTLAMSIISRRAEGSSAGVVSPSCKSRDRAAGHRCGFSGFSRELGLPVSLSSCPTPSISELLPPAELCCATCPSMVSKDTVHSAQLGCHSSSPLSCQFLLDSVLLTLLLTFLSQPLPPGTVQGFCLPVLPCTWNPHARQKLWCLCSSPSSPSPALVVLTLW